MHCDKFGIYLGRLEPEDLTESLRRKLIDTWNNKFNRFRDRNPDEVFFNLTARNLTAHLFRCTECESVFSIFYERSATPTMYLSQFVNKISTLYGDSFTETWFRVETKDNNCTVITEMCGNNGYSKIEIDADGEIVSGEQQYDYVRELKEKGVRIIPDEPDED